MPEKIHCFCLFVINVIKMCLFCFILKLSALYIRKMKALVWADENIVMKNPTKVSYWK